MALPESDIKLKSDDSGLLITNSNETFYKYYKLNDATSTLT